MLTSVFPSVHMEKLGSPINGFSLNLTFGNFWTNCTEKFKTRYNLTRITSSHFVWRSKHIFDHNSLISPQNQKYFRQKLYRKSKHTACAQFFFRKTYRIWDKGKGKAIPLQYTIFYHRQTQPFLFDIYRVIHKSVKHFKNSQQIDNLTDHGIFYADRERERERERERNCPGFSYIFHRCSMCPPLVIRQTSMR
jgi:hypothetical protein